VTLGYKNKWVTKTYTFRERDLERESYKNKGTLLGYKNKERDKVTKTKREILVTGYKNFVF